MILIYSGTLRLEFQGESFRKFGSKSITAVPAFLVKESEPGGDKKDHEPETCIHGNAPLAPMVKISQKPTINQATTEQKEARIMIPAHSATRHFKCQEKTKIKIQKKITGKIKEKGTLLNSFSQPNKSTSIPACFTVRSRATKQQQLPRNRGQEDHGPNNQLIYGAVPLLKRTIQTPKEAMIQREVHP